MTENQLGFLYQISSSFSSKIKTYKILKSYYLMRCNDITKGYGLPAKHFSSRARCPHCCLEWTRDSDVKVKPLNLSHKKLQRIRSRKKSQFKNKLEKQSNLSLQVNEMIQTCTFCTHSTTTKLVKPEREYIKSVNTKEPTLSKANNQKQQENKTAVKKPVGNKGSKNIKQAKKNEPITNLYSNAFEVFSLKNAENTISSSIKEPVKVIKNNKKRKDKFAGLCQKAVLASATLKQKKETLQQPQNKLNLFLKPSSG